LCNALQTGSLLGVTTMNNSDIRISTRETHHVVTGSPFDTTALSKVVARSVLNLSHSSVSMHGCSKRTSYVIVTVCFLSLTVGKSRIARASSSQANRALGFHSSKGDRKESCFQLHSQVLWYWGWQQFAIVTAITKWKWIATAFDKEEHEKQSSNCPSVNETAKSAEHRVSPILWAWGLACLDRTRRNQESCSLEGRPWKTWLPPLLAHFLWWVARSRGSLQRPRGEGMPVSLIITLSIKASIISCCVLWFLC